MTRMYSRISESFIGPRPIVLRAVNPVPTPNTILPGASWLSVANACRAYRRNTIARHDYAGAELDL